MCNIDEKISLTLGNRCVGVPTATL